MKKYSLLLWIGLMTQLAYAQEGNAAKVRFVIGVSVPELLHTGVSIDVSKFSQVGIAAGVGPSWGQLWPSLNAEHRLYFGKVSEVTNRKKWFFRQGATYFPAGQDFTVTLSAGVDLNSKRFNWGWTIDAGLFGLYPKPAYYTYFPSLRLQFYSYFKKSS